MKNLHVVNTRSDRTWDEADVMFPENLDEAIERYGKEGIWSMVNHSFPIKLRGCKDDSRIQEYADSIFRGEISRSKGEKQKLVEALSGKMDKELLEQMTIKQLKALKQTLYKVFVEVTNQK